MNYRTLLVVVSVVLVPVCVPAQEVNLGYDKTDPIVLALDQEYAGSTVADRERKYFMAHVEPEVEYRIDLTGLSSRRRATRPTSSCTTTTSRNRNSGFS